MCGIWALLSKNYASKYTKEELQNAWFKIKGRGPDASQYLRLTPNLLYGFHRLSINDTSMRGMQPFVHRLNAVSDSNKQVPVERVDIPILTPQLKHSQFKTPIFENETFEIENGQISVQVNGEIYNAFLLAKEYGFDFSSGSDSEIIPFLYKYFNGDIYKLCNSLDGVFAFILYDKDKDILFAARDPIGVKPLYIGRDNCNNYNNDSIILSSESKSIVTLTNDFEAILPGNYWRSDRPNETTRWFHIKDPLLCTCDDDDDDDDIDPADININGATANYNTVHVNVGFGSNTYAKIANAPYKGNAKISDEHQVHNEDEALKMIRQDLVSATRKRLMADRQIGCFLSGGLDSSLITALVSKYNPYSVNSYAIGMKGGKDFLHAQTVAKHLKLNHYEIEFTSEEGINAIEQVIYALETCDVLAIRSGVATYIMSKYVSDNCKDIVVYSGEGSDEVTQGYLWFHNAPNAQEADDYSHKMVNDLHMFDVLRVDRSTSANGLEVRVPFLDKMFVSNYFRINPNLRHPGYKGVEKYLMRKAFDHDLVLQHLRKEKNIEKKQQLEQLTDLLPQSVLWRKKEGMSDGISSFENPWSVILTEFVDKEISDNEFSQACQMYQRKGMLSPISKESLYYRKLYSKHFGDNVDPHPYHWVPQWSSIDENQ